MSKNVIKMVKNIGDVKNVAPSELTISSDMKTINIVKEGVFTVDMPVGTYDSGGDWPDDFEMIIDNHNLGYYAPFIIIHLEDGNIKPDGSVWSIKYNAGAPFGEYTPGANTDVFVNTLDNFYYFRMYKNKLTYHEAIFTGEYAHYYKFKYIIFDTNVEEKFFSRVSTSGNKKSSGKTNKVVKISNHGDIRNIKESDLDFNSSREQLLIALVDNKKINDESLSPGSVFYGIIPHNLGYYPNFFPMAKATTQPFMVMLGSLLSIGGHASTSDIAFNSYKYYGVGDPVNPNEFYAVVFADRVTE